MRYFGEIFSEREIFLEIFSEREIFLEIFPDREILASGADFTPCMTSPVHDFTPCMTHPCMISPRA